MRKNKFWKVLYYLNIITLGLGVVEIATSFLPSPISDAIATWEESSFMISMTGTFLSISVIAFGIYNIIIWSKFDKHLGRFFALFFLLGLYTPFYFKKAIKNGWVS
jgi:hypothetical protein